MHAIVRSLLCVGSGLVGFTLAMGTLQAQQVVPDGSINTIVNSVNGRDFVITGGGKTGGNLFHSFSEFSVQTGGSVAFNNAMDVQNIFTRVTGSNVSSIDGVIRADGRANLFLLNPNGILFGPNAALNIGGSFLGTTASRIKFADASEFNALNTTPLLTMTVPVGLQMGQNPGAIQVTGTGHKLALVAAGLLPIDRSQSPMGLQVSPSSTLALIGSEITLVGGVLTAPSGHLELGSASSGQINLTQTNHGWRFEYGSIEKFQDIRLSQRALVDASGDGGSIQLYGQNIKLSESSAGLIQHSGSQRGGDAILNASNSITLEQSQPGTFSTRVETQSLGMGATGNIQLTAQRLSLQNGAMINSASYAPGGSGLIKVDIAESIELFGAFPGDTTTDISRIGAGSVFGKTGDISITTKKLSLKDGASIFSSTAGSSLSGSLAINATSFVELIGSKPNVLATALSTSTYSSGNGGSLVIKTPRLLIQEGGTISSATYGDGNAGNIFIDTSDRLDVSGISMDSLKYPSRITASALSPAPILQYLLGIPGIPRGSAGNVIINGRDVYVRDGAQIGVNNIGSGNAGNLSILADSLSLSNAGGLTASTSSGEGGNIYVNLNSILTLRGGSRIDTQASGVGNGGNIDIKVPVILGIGNSDIIANASKGQGGNIDVTTQGIFGLKFRPLLTADSDITASSEFGVNGTVQVNTIGVNPSSGLVELPVDTIDPSQKIATSCAAQNDSSFVATGRGGVPENPMQVAIVIDRTWSDLRSITMATPKPRIATASMPIEATALTTNAQGQVELIGARAIASNPQGVNCSRQ
jgi:filamentous hemagglutinin family protein